MRIAIGNGVRADIWTEFLNRFGDIKVRELYAATEGNIGFMNYTSKIGAVGRVNFVHKVGGGQVRRCVVVEPVHHFLHTEMFLYWVSNVAQAFKVPEDELYQQIRL